MTTPAQTPLEAEIIRQIKRLGPLSISEYMARCLYHPDHGYYTTQHPLGRTGDFITAPEISQMFGELLGLSLAQAWLDQGAPDPFCLAEFGPGSGQLIADLMRATRSVPGFHKAANLHLLEVNAPLRAAQNEKLSAYDPTWITILDALPDLPLFLVANEFFDCFPINQFIKTPGGWDEKIVAVEADQLTFARRSVGVLSGSFPQNFPEGSILELCPAANAIIQTIDRHIATHGGAALIVDYGSENLQGDTFQAVKSHEKTSPLVGAGTADLTAHVNFSALQAACQNAKFCGPTPQGVFLERLGVTTRAQSLAKTLSGDDLETHIAAHRRLTHPDEMGDLFKTCAIIPKTAPCLAGIEP